MEFWFLCIIGLCLGLISLILEVVKVPGNIMSIIYEIISVFAAISFIGFFSGMIIDFITFLAFYFSLDEVILNSMLLSIGNNVGDFFGNGALAKAGEGLMGGFAIYSGQIFNNFIGFSMGIYAGYKNNQTEFDIFGLNIEGPLPPKHYFLMAILILVIFLFIFTYTNLWINKFQLTKKMAFSLLTIYLIYFSSALTFGILTRG